MVICDRGETLFVRGTVDLSSFNDQLHFVEKNLTEGIEAIDFEAVTEFDSSIVSLMLFCLRFVEKHIKFVGVPDAAVTLAKLYGVDELLKVG
jgi:ABC-type transporter Mla MlaB component